MLIQVFSDLWIEHTQITSVGVGTKKIDPEKKNTKDLIPHKKFWAGIFGSDKKVEESPEETKVVEEPPEEYYILIKQMVVDRENHITSNTMSKRDEVVKACKWIADAATEASGMKPFISPYDRPEQKPKKKTAKKSK